MADELLLSTDEIKAVADSPEALTAIIDWHEQDLTMAEAFGYDDVVKLHEPRIAELKALRSTAEAKRAEKVHQ